VVYNFGRSCLSVRRQRLKALTSEVHICTFGASPGNLGQVRTWRSLGQGQGHRRKGSTTIQYSHNGNQHKSWSLQCENSIANNSASKTQRWTVWPIAWHDCHLCHV